MPWMRDLVLRVVGPGTRADWEARSRQWQIACPVCGRAKDLWAAGGLRVRASGRKRVLGHCSGCGTMRRLELSRATD